MCRLGTTLSHFLLHSADVIAHCSSLWKTFLYPLQMRLSVAQNKNTPVRTRHKLGHNLVNLLVARLVFQYLCQKGCEGYFATEIPRLVRIRGVIGIKRHLSHNDVGVSFSDFFPIYGLSNEPFKHLCESVVAHRSGGKAEHVFRLNFAESAGEMGGAEMMALVKDRQAE